MRPSGFAMTSNFHPLFWGPYFLAGTILLLGLSVKPTSFIPRWIFFLGFAVYLVAFTSLDGAVSNFGVGSALFTIVFVAFDFLVLTDVQRVLKMEGDAHDKIEDAPFIERVKWGINLMMNPRGIGWIDPFAPKAPCIPTPPSATTSRLEFVLSKLFGITINVILFDFLGFLNRANPCFKQHGLPVADTSFLWRLELAFGLAAGEYLLLTTLHCIYSIILVGLGVSEPRQWPALFGSLFEAFTVRRFWGRYWHQMMRRFVLSHASFFSRKLKLPDRSKRASFLRLFVAFFLSGCIHFAGDYMSFHRWNHGGSFIFFMIQPFAIVFEEVIIFLSRKWKFHMPRGITRLVGYVWVCLWFWYTVPIFLEPLLRAGFFESGPSFSLILGLKRGEWFPKPL